MAKSLYLLDKLIHTLSNNTRQTQGIDKYIPNGEMKQTEQKEIESDEIRLCENHDEDDLNIGTIKTMMKQFVDQREWNKFHTPRNLVLALVGEIGELSEIFQWRGIKLISYIVWFTKHVPQYI